MCVIFYVYIGLVPTIVPESSLTVAANCSLQGTSVTPIIRSPSVEYSQQNISQPNSLVSIVSDTHTTTSPVTTFSVVECLTTSSSVVTSISGQHVSTITTTAGTVCMYMYLIISTIMYFTPYFSVNETHVFEIYCFANTFIE